MTAEEERTRLIGDIARVLRDDGADGLPDEARSAALTLIGWLARRMPGEPVSRCDIARCRGITYPAHGEAPKEHDGPPSQKRRVAPTDGKDGGRPRAPGNDRGRPRGPGHDGGHPASGNDGGGPQGPGPVGESQDVSEDDGRSRWAAR